MKIKITAREKIWRGGHICNDIELENLNGIRQCCYGVEGEGISFNALDIIVDDFLEKYPMSRFDNVEITWEGGYVK